MNMTKFNVIFWVIVLVMVTPISWLIVQRRKPGYMEAKIKKERLYYHKMYVYMYNNVLLRKKFRHISSNYSSMMCYDYDTLKRVSVQTFLKSALTSILMPIAGLIAFGDVLLAALTALIAYVYYDMTVDIAIDKQQEKIVRDLAFTVQSIADNYAVTESIPRAIIACERSSLLEKPISQIYEIITDENGYDLLMDFKRQNPIRLLGTLASACYISNEEGDTKANNAGHGFADEMGVLYREANAKVRSMLKTRIAFKSLNWLALVGVVISPICDWYLLTKMPGTALYVNGLFGSVVRTLIILSTIIVYYVISVLTRPSVVNEVDKSEIIDKISKNPKVFKFVEKLYPKKFKTKISLQESINGAISSKDERYIYTMKVLASGGFFLATLFFLIVFTITAKVSLWNNYGSLSFIPTTTERKAEQQEQLILVDKEYMTSEFKLQDDETEALIRARVRGISDMDIQTEVDRLSTKWDYYYSIRFQFWFILIAYAMGIVGWFTPELTLALRKKLVRFEATQDVMQLQTIMLVLSHTKMDVYRVLKWLMNESTVHKAALRYAMIEYSSDPEEAIQRLRDAVTERDMKRIVSKLEKSIENLALAVAFRDIEEDKQQSLILNETLQEEERESRKYLAKMLCYVPAIIALGGSFMLPIALLGLKQLLLAFASMS